MKQQRARSRSTVSNVPHPGLNFLPVCKSPTYRVGYCAPNSSHLSKYLLRPHLDILSFSSSNLGLVLTTSRRSVHGRHSIWVSRSFCIHPARPRLESWGNRGGSSQFYLDGGCNSRTQSSLNVSDFLSFLTVYLSTFQVHCLLQWERLAAAHYCAVL